jgi:hypothetical protein
VAQVAAAIQVASLPRIALSLNGLPVDTDQLMLFPGGYTLSASDAHLVITDGSFLVTSPSERPDTSRMVAGVSGAGRDAIRAAAHKKFSACIKQRALKPSGCAFGVRLQSGFTARKSTIRWTIRKGGTAMKKLKLALDSATTSIATARVTVDLKCTFRSTNGYVWYGYSGLSWVQADLAGGGVKITFG